VSNNNNCTIIIVYNKLEDNNLVKIKQMTMLTINSDFEGNDYNE